MGILICAAVLILTLIIYLAVGAGHSSGEKKAQTSTARQDLTSEQQDLAELEQRLMGELANEQQQLTMEMRDSIQAFLKTYNKAKKYDYILSRSGDNILLANPRFDITRDVVNGLNKRYKAKPEVKQAIGAK